VYNGFLYDEFPIIRAKEELLDELAILFSGMLQMIATYQPGGRIVGVARPE
jgi:hypothetical protein